MRLIRTSAPVNGVEPIWEMNAMVKKEVATPTGIEPVLPA